MEKIINDEELKNLFVELNGYIDESKAIQKQAEDLRDEQNKIGFKVNNLKERMNPILEKYSKELSEDDFVVVSGIQLKDNEVVATISNVVEDFKKDFLEQKKKFEELQNK